MHICNITYYCPQFLYKPKKTFTKMWKKNENFCTHFLYSRYLVIQNIFHSSAIYCDFYNLNSFPQLLLLLSGDIILNPDLVHQDTSQCSNEECYIVRMFEQRVIFLHLNMNSLLSRIRELHYIARSTNVAAIGICESKLDALASEQEISLHNYKILHLDREKQIQRTCGLLCKKGI